MLYVIFLILFWKRPSVGLEMSFQILLLLCNTFILIFQTPPELDWEFHRYHGDELHLEFEHLFKDQNFKRIESEWHLKSAATATWPIQYYFTQGTRLWRVFIRSNLLLGDRWCCFTNVVSWVCDKMNCSERLILP